MNSKWYTSTFFLLLFIVFGTLQKQINAPNQEIVLEFNNGTQNFQNKESTVANLSEKLKDLGVTNISISENDNGILRIAYHSKIDADRLQQLLGDLENQQPQAPKEDQKEYNLSVFELIDLVELQQTHDNFIVELKSNFDRSTTNQNTGLAKENSCIVKPKFSLQKAKATFQKSFCKYTSTNGEPEVRAGPLT